MLQKPICHILFLLCSLLCGAVSFAQQGFYIPKAGKVFFTGDSATIFSNVLNNGSLGVGKKAVLNFKGQVWENDPQSLITDETNGGTGVAGNGGLVRFLADTTRQKLIGGYNAASRLGPIFSSLQIQNSYGVELDRGSAKVGQELIFSKGLVYLNSNIFVMGHNKPGTISGYDSSRFFVTGTQANGSLVLRENIKRSDGQVVFPVGTKANAYTPAAVQSRSSAGDNYYVTVFDGVRSNVFNGSDLGNASVNKTWQIGKTERPNEDEVDIFLQHLAADEGGGFQQKREHAYISKFSGMAWDEGFPQSLPAAGYLTSGTALQNSGVNSRTFYSTVSSASYFIKLTGNRDSSAKTKLVFGAYRVNSNIVRVNWQTNPEINVHYFVVERRLSKDASFTSVDTISSSALNGLSFTNLYYGINDSNNYRGISFYRLKVVEYTNLSFYSNTVAVSGAGFTTVSLWPNPTPNKFYLTINSPDARSVVIFNNLGQKMWATGVSANAQTYLEIKDHGLLPGTYYVSIFDQGGAILQTEKLVIIGR